MTDLEKINKLLLELSEIGETFYDEKYRTGQINYGAIGLAISSVTDNPNHYLKIAFEALENLNFHNVCAVIDFIEPTLHPPLQRDLAEEWLSNLERVRKMINSRGVLKVYTNWDYEKSRHNVETYRLTAYLRKVEVKEKK